jgi:uncharacterized membrane protein YkvA (DUF1232 family)
MNIESWKIKAKRLKSQFFVLYLACKDPRTPWYAKALAVVIIGYVSSPIHLIPDFIPVIGYLDDLIIVPAAIALLIKIIPKEVLEDCAEKARSKPTTIKSKNWIAPSIIVLIWLLAIYVFLRLLLKLF